LTRSNPKTRGLGTPNKRNNQPIKEPKRHRRNKDHRERGQTKKTAVSHTFHRCHICDTDVTSEFPPLSVMHSSTTTFRIRRLFSHRLLTHYACLSALACVVHQPAFLFGLLRVWWVSLVAAHDLLAALSCTALSCIACERALRAYDIASVHYFHTPTLFDFCG
jgi:hypothetical protein